MPVKRRIGKRRRISPEAEAEAWRDYWETGYDFFGDAAKFAGVVEPISVWPQEARAAAEVAFKAASEDAWKRAGHLFKGERHAG